MKKTFPVISGLIILLVALTLAACGGSANTMPGVETIVALTFEAMTATQATLVTTAEASPEPQVTVEPQTTPEAALVQTVSQQPNVEFEGVSFYLDYQLASSWSYEITTPPDPASDNPFQQPSHYRMAFQDFLVSAPDDSRGWRKPRLYIIPVTNMQSFPDGGYGLDTMSVLNQILVSKPTMVEESMPVLPGNVNFDNGEVYHGKLKYLDFQNGSGVRFLAEYSQAPFPFGKAMSYIFQGITSDGQYYISLTLPVEQTALTEYNAPYNSILEAGEFEAFVNSYSTYEEGAIKILELAPDSSFTPDLVRLDELVQSLTVKP